MDPPNHQAIFNDLLRQSALQYRYSGYMSINRFHDCSTGLDIVQVMPGTLYVTNMGECITTILGSCISVCLRDPVTNIGGLNHFMLPGSHTNIDRSTETNNYGRHAMTQLIEKMEAMGALTHRCEAKIFGGGSMFPNDQEIGSRNIDFASDFLEYHRIDISSKDVGLYYSRRIRFYTDTGKVMVKRLRSLHNKQISKQEVDYENYLTNVNHNTEYDPSRPLIES